MHELRWRASMAAGFCPPWHPSATASPPRGCWQRSAKAKGM